MRRKTIGHVVALGAVTLTAILCAVNAGQAAKWNTCNGSSVKWRKSFVITRNRCSIADTGDRNTAYWNGIRSWDNFSDLVDGFEVNPISDCVVAIGDEDNEIGVVPPEDIDGARGLTITEVGPCGIGANDIDHADTFIASDTTFVPLHGGAPTSDGRVAFVHELGHFFGFEHESNHGAMRSLPPLPVTGGSALEHATTFPTDTLGMHALYGFATNGPNLIPSANGISGGQMVALNPGGTVTVCRGTTRNFRFYVGNSGNLASGTYNLRIRFNTLSPLGGGYTATTTTVATFTHSLGAFTESTFDLPVTLPASLPSATFNVYIDLDHTGSINELREGDNTTFGNTRIRVNC